MTNQETLKLALEALKYIYEGSNNQGAHTGISWRCVSNKAKSVIKVLEKALKQEHDLQDTRCECCGYMTHQREHMGCIRFAKQEQGLPVAHINQNGVIHEAYYPWGIHNILEPLYRHPPQQRKPLTDEQIRKASLEAGMQEHYMGFHSGFTRFARAIEAAHGIKENT